MNLRLYVAIILFLVCCPTTMAEDKDLVRLDHEISRSGMYQGVESKTIEELRLNCSSAMERRDFKTVRKMAKEMYDLTLLDSKSDAHGNACFYLGASELFVADSEKGADLLRKALEISEINHNDSLTGKVYNCLGIYEAKVNANYYLAQQYFLRSLEYPDMNGSVYSNLAQLARLQKDTTGMEYARKCYQYGIDNKEPYYVYSGLISMAEFQIQMEDYSLAEATLQKARKEADTQHYADRSRLDFLHAVILSHLNKTHESNEILLSLHDSIQANYPIYLAELQYVIGKNYEKQGDLLTSNEWLEKAIKSGKDNSSSDYIGWIYRQLSDNYHAIGDETTALKYMSKAFDFQENASKSERERMIKERDLTDKMMKRDKEIAIAKQKMQTHKVAMVAFAFISLCLLIIIYYVMRSMRKRNELYRHIVSSNLTLIKEKERFMAKIEELESLGESKDVKKSLNLKPSKSKSLFDSLQSLMLDKKLYRNPLLTREDIISALETNSTYLSNCIKENADMNYSQYINSFRVADAIGILSDKNKLSMSIKEISEEVGFNSMTTFFKLFQQATGMSPAAYRKSLSTL